VSEIIAVSAGRKSIVGPMNVKYLLTAFCLTNECEAIIDCFFLTNECEKIIDCLLFNQ